MGVPNPFSAIQVPIEGEKLDILLTGVPTEGIFRVGQSLQGEFSDRAVDHPPIWVVRVETAADSRLVAIRILIRDWGQAASAAAESAVRPAYQ